MFQPYSVKFSPISFRIQKVEFHSYDELLRSIKFMTSLFGTCRLDVRAALRRRSVAWCVLTCRCLCTFGFFTGMLHFVWNHSPELPAAGLAKTFRSKWSLGLACPRLSTGSPIEVKRKQGSATRRLHGFGDPLDACCGLPILNVLCFPLLMITKYIWNISSAVTNKGDIL